MNDKVSDSLNAELYYKGSLAKVGVFEAYRDIYHPSQQFITLRDFHVQLNWIELGTLTYY